MKNIESLQKKSKFLVSVAQAAELLHLKEQTLRNWQTVGRVTPIKIGRRTFYDIRDLNHLIEDKKTISPHEWIRDAIKIIELGVDLMPLNLMSQWTGVRALLETAPDIN